MTKPLCFLFYISENYSFEILRPLQRVINDQGHVVKWFVEGSNINSKLFYSNEEVLPAISDVISYAPHAVFVPGNHVPRFIPGIKVQVFHGLEWKKKGHFRIRGWFDLYCTHGKATTNKFQELSTLHKHFEVKETGWPKLDPLFSTLPYDFNLDAPKKRLLFAPTFSPSLTSAYLLFDEINKLSKLGKYNILVKFHPKMAEDAIELYKSIESENIKVINEQDVNCLLQWADTLISDTSSIIGEFSLLQKPIITLNNHQPGDYLINISEPHLLEPSIEKALYPSEDYINSLNEYANSLHPYKDGLSSLRVLNATIDLISRGLSNNKAKPFNVIRSLKLRKKLNYWKFMHK